MTTFHIPTMYSPEYAARSDHVARETKSESAPALVPPMLKPDRKELFAPVVVHMYVGPDLNPTPPCLLCGSMSGNAWINTRNVSDTPVPDHHEWCLPDHPLIAVVAVIES